MFSSVAMPASTTTVGGVSRVRGASACTISANVCASAALPAKTRLRLGKPLASRTNARVTSGQSVRFSLDLPKAALAFAWAVPSK